MQRKHPLPIDYQRRVTLRNHARVQATVRNVANRDNGVRAMPAIAKEGPANGLMRPAWKSVPTVCNSDVRLIIASVPPGTAAAHARRPSPTEVVIVIPCSALEGQIAPGIPGDPNIAKARRPNPMAAAIRVPTSAGCLIRRPYVSLPRHVIPVAIGIQVAPCGIAVVVEALVRSGAGGARCSQRLVPVRIPAIP